MSQNARLILMICRSPLSMCPKNTVWHLAAKF
jgi:hypothetical protein